MRIKVEQEHIDAARNGLRPHGCCTCPVALALLEQTGVKWAVGTRTMQRLGVKESDELIQLPVDAVGWIMRYDFGDTEVQPFEFELEDPR